MLVSFGAESTRSNEGHKNRKGRQKDTRRQRKVLVAKWLDLFTQKFGISRDELFRKPRDENDRAHAFPCAHFVEKPQAESLPPTKQDFQAILEQNGTFNQKEIATIVHKLRNYDICIGVKKLLGLLDMIKQMGQQNRLLKFLNKLEEEGFAHPRLD